MINMLKGEIRCARLPPLVCWVIAVLSSIFMIYGADVVEPSYYNNCSSIRPLQEHPDIRFLGIGYNLLEGNPGGRDFSEGGLDPGLKTLRPIIQLRYDNESKTHDNEYLIPNDVIYNRKVSTSEVCNTYAIYGTRSLQEELLTQIRGGIFLPLRSFAFGASAGYNTFTREMEKMENVYVTLNSQTIRGEGRIQISLDGLFFTDEFAGDLVRLPSNYTKNRANYFRFLDDWGTHVVIEAMFGQMEHVSLQYSLSSIVYEEGRKIGAGISFGGVYKGFDASVGISGSYSFNFQNLNTSFQGTKITTTRGSAEENEPINYVLMAIDEILEHVQLPPKTQSRAQSSGTPMDTLKQNLRRALEDYPEYKGISESSDPETYLQPLTWPDGTYTLPKPSSGCPNGGGVSFTEGNRLFDTNDDTANNRWTPEDIHLDLPIKEPSQMKMTFCTKTTPQSGDYRREWQSGTYCLFQSGKSCPGGFETGSISWDDQNHGNGNERNGIVPEGEYGEDTKMFFCCRRDAEASKPIILPVDDDFVLMTPTGHCQQVQGMSVSLESFLWDSAGESKADGVHPFPGIQDHDHRNDVNITFCYYQKNLSALGGATGSHGRKRRNALDILDQPGPCKFFSEIASSACFITPGLVILFFLCCALVINIAEVSWYYGIVVLDS